MANYIAIQKTNDFAVNDEKAYLDLCELLCCEDEIEFNYYTDENGKKLYSFGAYAIIEYFDENGDSNIEKWFEKLQPLLAEDSIFALIEIGNEKLRDVNAHVTIVSNNKIESVSIHQLIEEKWGTPIF